jgi:hypothetical protein
MAFDPIGALQTLQRHEGGFVVIGGVAARLWGSPTMTNDIDICYDRNPANLQRLAAALDELHARLRGVDDEVPFLLDATTLANGQNFTTSAGPLDVLGLPAAVKPSPTTTQEPLARSRMDPSTDTTHPGPAH